MAKVLQQTYQHETPIEDLRFTPENPNQGDVGAIHESIQHNGFFGAVYANRATSKIIAGEHTTRGADAAGLTHIPVIWIESNKNGEPLSDAEALRLLLADNRTAELAHRAADELADLLTALAITEDGLKGTAYDGDSLDDLLSDLEREPLAAAVSDVYSQKIEPPIYEPAGEKPPVDDLYDDEKTRALLTEIEAADMPEDVKAFLRTAAHRHTEIRFDRVAEFYAHAAPDVQRLIERSALVIIDFESAVKDGFVQLAEDIREIIINQNGAHA